MNASEHNKGVLNEPKVTIEMLKSLTGYKNCTDEELCKISESLKELCLLLHKLHVGDVDQDHGF